MNKLTTTVFKKGDTEAEIKGNIPVSLITPFIENIVKEYAQQKEAPGFRKGAVPPEMVAKDLDDITLWREAAFKVLGEKFPDVCDDHGIVPLGQPSLAFTTLVPNQDVSFTITTQIVPAIILPDYKMIALSVGPANKPEEVKQEEIDDVVMRLRKSIQKEKGGDLPEFSNEIVKQISKEHTDVEGFLKALSDNILKQKEISSKEEHRSRIIEAIIEKTPFSVPEILITQEVERMMEHITMQAKRLGTNFEDYLKETKKTEEELQKEFRVDAEKRARVQLLVNAIVKEEEVEIDEMQLEQEVARFKERPMEEKMDDETIRVWIRSILANEKVFEVLERVTENK